MKTRANNHTAFYKYLEPSLAAGNNEEIQKAKADWRRKYKAVWRRNNRKENKEITVSWAKDELHTLKTESKRHKLSNTAFIKKAVMAYIDKRYIVPDELTVRKLLQFLAMQYNDIEDVGNERELRNKIDEQERAIRVALYSPKTLDQIIIEAMRKDPMVSGAIYRLLETGTYDT